MTPYFWQLPITPLHQFSKFNNFLLVCWFLGKSLSNFVSSDLTLYNWYCHNELKLLLDGLWIFLLFQLGSYLFVCVKCKFLDTFFSDTSQHVNVFPYSVFYVFYEQYLTMVEDTAISLSISLGAVFIVTFALGGLDIKTAIVTSFTIILILVNWLIKI